MTLMYLKGATLLCVRVALLWSSLEQAGHLQQEYCITDMVPLSALRGSRVFIMFINLIVVHILYYCKGW